MNILEFITSLGLSKEELEKRMLCTAIVSQPDTTDVICTVELILTEQEHMSFSHAHMTDGKHYCQAVDTPSIT